MDSRTDQKIVQQSSKIWMLNAELKGLRNKHEQLLGIHNKYRIQENKVSTAIQTDQVNIVFAVT